MMSITTNVLIFFLLAISLSLIFYSYLSNPLKTGEGFLKLVFSISSAGYFASFIILIVSLGVSSKVAYSFFLLGLATFILRNIQKEKREIKGQILQITIIILSLILCYFIVGQNVYKYILSLSSLLFLGIITYSMIMGHWYLVTPKLSEKPLLNATYITWFLLALKFGTSVFYYFHYQKYFSPGSLLGGGYLFNWILLIMRYVWGYLIILIMSILSFKLLKMRSLQSATGILYAETFFIFVGELISIYFFFSYGVFL